MMPVEDPNDCVEVTTPLGIVRGVWRWVGEGTRSAAFLGIPFAEPPVGERRFGEPVPVGPWDGVRDALEYGPTAQRGDPGEGLIPEPSIPGLGTLNVNVFTPNPSGEVGLLPVLVWIHGGGFVAGSPASPWYDGAAFNRDGVVTVSLGYRLGFDGFGLIEGAPANRGLRDLMVGLQWVQDNIEAFGGDPARVTIGGQSAGGLAVLALLGMKSSQHLFNGALAISAPMVEISPTVAADYTRRLAEELEVPPTLEALRAVPEAKLLEAQNTLGKISGLGGIRKLLRTGLLPLAPVVDGELLTQPIAEAIATGTGADKPLLLGTTDDEVTGILERLQASLQFIPLPLIFKLFGLDSKILPAYLAANPELAGKPHSIVAGRYVTDKVFRSFAVSVAGARGDAPTWVYRFAYPSVVHGTAIHCIDVPFWFDCLDEPSAEKLTGPNCPQGLADAVHGSAVRLVCGGNPGWTAWSDVPGTDEVFGAPDGGEEAIVEQGGFDGAMPLGV